VIAKQQQTSSAAAGHHTTYTSNISASTLLNLLHPERFL
jgi:hypothetical protein